MFPADGILGGGQKKRYQSKGGPIRLLNTGRPGKRLSNTEKDVEGERRRRRNGGWENEYEKKEMAKRKRMKRRF